MHKRLPALCGVLLKNLPSISAAHPSFGKIWNCYYGGLTEGIDNTAHVEQLSLIQNRTISRYGFDREEDGDAAAFLIDLAERLQTSAKRQA